MALEVIRKDNRFRVQGQEISLDWLADTCANRKATLVFLRLLSTNQGKPLFTHQRLAKVVNSSNRQAASNHLELFRACGGDFIQFLHHKRKVDDEVVSMVLTELKTYLLAVGRDLKARVNARLGRDDLSVGNINVALEQISAKQIRQPMQKQLACGQAHYREEYLLKEMVTSLDSDAGQKAGIAGCESEGMVISDPTAISKLVSPEAELSDIDKPLKWLTFLMALYFHGVPLSVLAKWFSVHKTTALRWILGLSLALWPEVSRFLVCHVKGTIAYINEKWIKIKRQWHYWFVVLDHTTGLPIVAELLQSRSRWACQWIGVALTRLKKMPRVIITDGLPSYRYVLEGVNHLTCLFHHQQGVTHWLKKHFAEKQEIAIRKPLMKRIFQTPDKRTVKRRLDKLKSSAEALQISEWVHHTEADLPKLLPAVGSVRLPSTTNAIERFFRAFNRFYKVRCGFSTVKSAKRELIFFLLMYLFVQQADSGKAPIESIVPRARGRPFFQLVNAPLKVAVGLVISFALF